MENIGIQFDETIIFNDGIMFPTDQTKSRNH